MKPIYLDYNATTPIDPEVAEAMRPFLYEHFGNPSSGHWYGAQTKRAVELARRQVAGLLDCRPDEVIFTSGGSESNNHAIKGAALAHRSRGDHIITSAIEHPAVIEVCRHLEDHGFRVTYLPVDRDGLLDPAVVSFFEMRDLGLVIEELQDFDNPDNRFVHYRQLESVEIEVPGKLPINLDGEPYRWDRVRFQVHPKALRVVLPEDRPVLKGS